MRELRKYADAKDYLMKRNQILYQEVKEWMHLAAFEYNTGWYSMKAFRYFKKNASNPDENIRSIRLYATSESIPRAYRLGKKLIEEMYFQITGSCEFADKQLDYIAKLIKKYHVGNMTLRVSFSDDEINTNKIKLKNMKTGEEKEINMDATEIVTNIKN